MSSKILRARTTDPGYALASPVCFGTARRRAALSFSAGGDGAHKGSQPRAWNIPNRSRRTVFIVVIAVHRRQVQCCKIKSAKSAIKIRCWLVTMSAMLLYDSSSICEQHRVAPFCHSCTQFRLVTRQLASFLAMLLLPLHLSLRII